MIRVVLSLAIALIATGCASNVGGARTLSTYDNMETGERRFLQVQEYADPVAVAQVEAIFMDRAHTLPDVASDAGVTSDQFERVIGTLSQTMCRRLARGGFQVTDDAGAASHVLVLTITGFTPTNSLAAATSGVVSVFVPGPISPRLPIGIGELAVEGEVLDRDNTQIAAMNWASRNHLSSAPGALDVLRGGLRETADGEALAEVFADSFGDMIVEAREAGDGERRETERGICTALFDADTELETEGGTPAADNSPEL